MSKNDLSSIIARIECLEAVVFKGKEISAEGTGESYVEKPELDFSLNIRAFANKFAKNKSGPKKFVLLLAYLARGEPRKDINLAEIREKWNSMSSKRLLDGEFNYFYSNEAKTQGWVDSNKRGTYCLTDNWREVYE